VAPVQPYLHWETDSEVSVDSDQENKPDCHGLCDRCQGPGVWFDVRIDSVEPRGTTTTVRLTVDDLEWLDEDACGQVGGVDDCQRLQQPVGSSMLVAMLISSENGHRQSITNPAGDTQRPEQIHLDDQSVRRHGGVSSRRAICR